MTTQDLKNNRNEIIARINEIANPSKTSEIMTAMVNIVEGGMNEADDCVELVDEVVELLGYEKEIECKLWGNNCEHSTQIEYERSKLGGKWTLKN